MPTSQLTQDLWLASLYGAVLCIGMSVLFAMFLRIARVPGGPPAAAIAGGLVAGLLLGPAVLHKADPDLGQRLFIAAAPEQEALDQLQVEQQAELTALRTVAATPETFEATRRQHAQASTPIWAALREAQAAARARTASFLLPLLGLAILLGTWTSMPRQGARSDTDGSALAVALFVVAFAALPTALVLRWIVDAPFGQAFAVGASVGAGSLFAGLPVRPRTHSARDPHIRLTTLLAAVFAAGILAWVVPAPAMRWLILPIGAATAGFMLGLVAPAQRAGRRISRRFVLGILLPPLAAFVGLQLDPELLLANWRPILVVVLALLTAGDGHFIGAWLSTQAFGVDRQRVHPHRHAVELVCAGTGLTQICFAFVLCASTTIQPHQAAGAAAIGLLLANGLLIELLANTHRRWARKLDDLIRSNP